MKSSSKVLIDNIFIILKTKSANCPRAFKFDINIIPSHGKSDSFI